MIDRHGHRIRVAYSEKEIIWLQAANSLDAYDRSQAFYDLSNMTGRSVAVIRDKANQLRQAELDLKAKVLAHSYEWRLSGPVLTARSHLGRKPGGDMSSIKPPSLASLMAGK